MGDDQGLTVIIEGSLLPREACSKYQICIMLCRRALCYIRGANPLSRRRLPTNKSRLTIAHRDRVHRAYAPKFFAALTSSLREISINMSPLLLDPLRGRHQPKTPHVNGVLAVVMLVIQPRYTLILTIRLPRSNPNSPCRREPVAVVYVVYLAVCSDKRHLGKLSSSIGGYQKLSRSRHNTLIRAWTTTASSEQGSEVRDQHLTLQSPRTSTTATAVSPSRSAHNAPHSPHPLLLRLLLSLRLPRLR